MAIPSQDLIDCKGCGQSAPPHKSHRLFCAPCARNKQAEYQQSYRGRQKAKPRIVTCKGCGREFDASVTGRVWRCPPCLREYHAQHAAAHKAWHADYSRQYRARLGDEYKVRMVQRRNETLASLDPEGVVKFRATEAARARRTASKAREDVFTAYGGKRCSCCGETEPMFLSIDHVNNDGADMRRNGLHARGGTAFYTWLRKSGFPSGFQVLCMNCNTGKHRNGGVCPHQSGKV